LFEETGWSYKEADLKTRRSNPNQKEKFTDIEFEFIQAAFEQETIQKYLAELSLQENTLLTIAVAIQQHPAASLAVALYMPPEVYESKTQILVWQDRSCTTVSMLSEKLKGYRKYRNLRPFGMLANVFDLDRAEDLLPMKIKYTYDMADKITKVTRAYHKLKQEDREPANEDIAEEIRKNIHEVSEEKDEWTGQMVETLKNAARKPGSLEFPVAGSEADGIVRTYDRSEIEKNWNTNWKPTDNVSALKASNRYCADFTKVRRRSFVIEPGKDLKAIKTDSSTGKGMIYYAARVEHNRWVAEKLILGFRAPTPEDAKKISEEKRKEAYKERLIHNDIRDYEALLNDDKGVDVREFDRNIVCSSPWYI
jgi:capsular polysaccharide biosynthesis protein